MPSAIAMLATGTDQLLDGKLHLADAAMLRSRHQRCNAVFDSI